jgi:hypothetical protein
MPNGPAAGMPWGRGRGLEPAPQGLLDKAFNPSYATKQPPGAHSWVPVLTVRQLTTSTHPSSTLVG